MRLHSQLMSLLLTLAPVCQAGKIVSVDPGKQGAFDTLTEATEQLEPGDTLWIAPGSGPYREALRIRTSGTPSEPITIEGNGNEITGFDTLTFHEGQAHPPVSYPFVLRFEGKRVRETAAGQFEQGVSYDAETGLLMLEPGTSDQGWEISTRQSVVTLQDVSHHLYRNLVATGSLNDGFNLHGDGEGLIFENITGSQNLDEGFSAHDTIRCEIRGGRFFENDNGLMNVDASALRLEGVDVYDNLGFGIAFSSQTRVEMVNVRTWNNGIVQLLLRDDVLASCHDLQVYHNPYEKRPWISYKESTRRTQPTTWDISKGFAWQNGQPSFYPITSPEHVR